MTFKDHFSAHATLYAQARPTYPPALFDWLANLCPQNELAWDAGCGNGQASAALAKHFSQVFATDPSDPQIAATTAHAKVRYAVEPAERCSLPDASADLVTVAQALHWFDVERFYKEARRVLKPDGRIAVWTYERSTVSPEVDAVFARLYRGELDAYWAPERRHVEAGYATLPFPFERIETPAFELRCDWTLPQYLAYLRSWSAVQKLAKQTGRDIVGEFESEMRAAWGEAETVREVRWPLTVIAGRT
jgi:SAM-dependent methyltransferase